MSKEQEKWLKQAIQTGLDEVNMKADVQERILAGRSMKYFHQA